MEIELVLHYNHVLTKVNRRFLKVSQLWLICLMLMITMEARKKIYETVT
jgi:hypothetical protein